MRLTMKFGFWVVMGMFLGCIVWLAAGCTAEQFDRADQAATSAQAVAQAADQVVKSPAAALIPAPALAIVQGAISIILTMFGIYSENKNRIKAAVIKSVVKAVDDTNSASMVKPVVKANLKAAGIETAGREIIAKAKAA